MSNLHKEIEYKLNKLDIIENKIDLLLDSDVVNLKIKKRLTAKEVEALTGINHRTILNRSNKPSSHHLHIPSIQLRTGRKYFERTVIERIFQLK